MKIVPSPKSTPLSPLFVLGAPRSGTTFLASLLSATKYSTPIESQFFIKYFKKLPEYGNLSSFPCFTQLASDILKERAVMQWKLDVDLRAIHQKVLIEGEFNYPSLINQLMLSRHDMKGRQTWGDKTPHYIEYIDVLNSLFPHAKFIYIVRDGRDVAQSLLGRQWGPNNIYTAAQYWSRLNTESNTIVELKSKGQLLEILYEDLTSNTENKIVEISEFLSETFSEKIVNSNKAKAKPENNFKWKSSMSIRNRQIFESEAYETLNRFGYETLSTRCAISKKHAILFKAHNKCIWLLFLLKTNIIDGIKIKFFKKEPFGD